MASIFVGAALGSTVASPLYEHFGWTTATLLGADLPWLALLLRLP